MARGQPSKRAQQSLLETDFREAEEIQKVANHVPK
jgi:hypothetical protein